MDTVSYEELLDALSDVEVPILGVAKANGKVARASAKEILRNYRSTIPNTCARKLAAASPSGDRSRVLWKLNCDLLEAGLTPGEVVVLVEGTVWNKFGEDRSRLWADVNKAAQKVAESAPPQSNGAGRSERRRSKSRTEPWSIPVDRYLAVESKDPAWMIEGLWTDRSHGIVAGEPKTRKSYLAIDIALSVATGVDCFGYFPVKRSGPVLMIQEEIGDAEMKKRLRHIAASKKLGGEVEKTDAGLRVRLPDPVPLFLRNRQGFDLSLGECYEQVYNEIVEKEIKLLILDPLQMMLGEIDENKTSEVRPVLKKLLEIKEATGCGVMIIHHYNKNQEKKMGQRMSGSHAWHGWVESALYLSKPEPLVATVEREFRNFEPLPKFDLEYLGGNERYEVAIKEEKRKRPPNKFERWCLKHAGISVKDVALKTKRSPETIIRMVERSPYLQVEKYKGGGKGRPINVIGKIKVE